MSGRRFVFDTNTIVSAFLFENGKPGRALDLAVELPRFSRGSAACGCKSFLVQLFVRQRSVVVKGGVSALWVVPSFDEGKDRHARLRVRGEPFPLRVSSHPQGVAKKLSHSALS